MKKFNIYIITFFAILFGISSCKKDFLAPPPTTVVDAKAIFSSDIQTQGFLANIYSELSGGLAEFGDGGFTQMSDEGEVGHPYITTNSVNAGSFDGSTNPDNASYANNYRRIRKCNILLANKELMGFGDNLKAQYVAEMQFLRAFFYSELIKRYAGVPLTTSPVAYEEIQDVAAQQRYKDNLKRATYAMCVDFIVKQLDSAATVLPWFPATDSQRGRATAAACLALKAKVLLVAASPLFNGSGNEITGYPQADPNRWKLAADAARDFFAKNNANANWYTLYTKGFDKLFNEGGRDPDNKEIIWYRQGNSQPPQLFNPPNRLGGFSDFNISLNLVDKFETATGLAIADPASGYNEQQWWVNRDPRLAFTVLRNGEAWKGANLQLYTENGAKGADYDVQLATGILMKKWQRNDASVTPIKWHYIRLAEIYLILAEAENEFNGPTTEAYTAINNVRARQSVTMPALPAGLTKEQFRARLQNERAVELAFENQRFFDVRRWKIADKTDNGPLYGFQITKSGAVITHTRFVVETRTFNAPRMFLYPIPEAEIFKGAAIVQNPGY